MGLTESDVCFLPGLETFQVIVDTDSVGWASRQDVCTFQDCVRALQWDEMKNRRRTGSVSPLSSSAFRYLEHKQGRTGVQKSRSQHSFNGLQGVRRPRTVLLYEASIVVSIGSVE